jgi:alpha-N-arabinofuranosidase
VTIARSDQIGGPYEVNPRNPILTHRNLGLDYPIVGTGHADLVQTQNGEWWMVLLAMRPYGGYFYNLGRETFLVPVVWEEGWPIVSPGIGRVEFEHAVPDLANHPWPSQPACDHFEAESLGPNWNFLRTPRDEFWSLRERPGYLRLHLRPQRLSELAHPSFVGRRQQHIDFVVRTCMEFSPQNPNECAGVVLLQNNDFHFRCVVSQGGKEGNLIRLIQRRAGEETILAEASLAGKRCYFKIIAQGQDYSFYVSTRPESWQPLETNVDGRLLSTPVAGGFVGAYVGLYASSNGETSENVADFDWFEYIGARTV